MQALRWRFEESQIHCNRSTLTQKGQAIACPFLRSCPRHYHRAQDAGRRTTIHGPRGAGRRAQHLYHHTSGPQDAGQTAWNLATRLLDYRQTNIQTSDRGRLPRKNSRHRNGNAPNAMPSAILRQKPCRFLWFLVRPTQGRHPYTYIRPACPRQRGSQFAGSASFSAASASISSTVVVLSEASSTLFMLSKACGCRLRRSSSLDTISSRDS